MNYFSFSLYLLYHKNHRNKRLEMRSFIAYTEYHVTVHRSGMR